MEHDVLAKRCSPKLNDILLTKIGTIGQAALVPSNAPTFDIFVSVAILRIRHELALPSFVTCFLNSDIARRYFERVAKGVGVPDLHLEDIAGSLIPLPELTEQSTLITAMDAARAKRRTKLAEADALLAGLDDYLLATLGLTPPPKDERKVFAVMCKTVPPRFDPHFHLPAFAQILRLLAANGGESLGCIVNFSDEVWKPEKHESATFRYIEISNVDTDTGEARTVETLVAEAPSRARMALHTNDIIISLTRPHHGAIAQITQELDGCIASTGFAVIRSIDESRITRDYLWCILRAKMSLFQMLQRASGGNYPAITESELAKVLIPIPDKDVQETIATEARRRREKARRLRAEAEADWQAAKRWFEEQQLGPA